MPKRQERKSYARDSHGFESANYFFQSKLWSISCYTALIL